MTVRMTVILGLVMSATTLAQGNGAGNGGGVHVCYDGKKVDEQGNRIIKSVEMYDLYEMRERYKKVYQLRERFPEDLATETDFLNYAYSNTKSKAPFRERGIAARLEAAVKLVETIISETDQVLDKIPDANLLMHGEDCEYDQLANWDNRTGFINVRTKYYNYIKKSPLDLAAFKTHEAFYFLDRKYNGARDSDNTRETNGGVYLATNGALKVRVKEFERKKSLVAIRPQWNDARCIDYVGQTDWKVSFQRLDDYRLPRLRTVVSEGVFDAGKVEDVILNRVKGRSFGPAFGRFVLYPGNFMDMLRARIVFESASCESPYEFFLEQDIARSSQFSFTVEP